MMDFLTSKFLVVFHLSLMASYLQSAIIEGPKNTTYFPGQGSIVLKCNVTAGVPIWMVNGSAYTLRELSQGELVGHNRTGANIIIETPVNNTKYICESLISTDRIIQSNAAVVYIAGAPDAVPDFKVVSESITIDKNSVNLTLNWGEPFNNFVSILTYVIRCSGDVTCPPDFNAPDNTTRNYTVTNLVSAVNYSFSVLAINSVNESLPSVLLITAPSVPGQISGVMLVCKPANLYNLCTLSWEPLIVGNGPLDQPLVYEVYYKGIVMNVPSPTSTLTFTAPLLPDDIFADNFTIIMTAVNKFGFAPIIVSNSVKIQSTSVINATAVLNLPFVRKEFHSIAVICTVRQDIEVDACRVIAVGDNMNNTDIALVSNGTATITIDGLACEMIYTILAGGVLNGDLVGPTSSYGTIVSGLCPVKITPILSPIYGSGSDSKMNRYVTYFPSQGSFDVTCNVTDQVPLWRVNDVTYTINQLNDGILLGHSQSNIANRSILTVNSPTNSTKYVCFITEDNMDILSIPVIVNIADVPSKVPVISVINQSISNDGDKVTLTLNWDEPFDNFNPVLSYTVSCIGNSSCPPSVTVYNDTSIYLSNLMLQTMYTFSVIATNSIGDGEAGVLSIITASIPDKVSGVDLICYPVNLAVECSAEWDVNVNDTKSDFSTGFMLYQVHYFEAMLNLTTTNNSLLFQAQAVLDDTYVGNVTIIVTAINQFGIGESSNPVTEKIFAPSITNLVVVLDTPNEYKDIHSISVTCIINLESEAKLCEVALTTPGNITITGNSSIRNGMAAITINGLKCALVYNITAGGTLNGTLVGPRSFHGTITAGSCPINCITTTSASDDTFSGGFVGGFVGTLVGTIIQATVFIVLFFMLKRYYSKYKIYDKVPVSETAQEATGYVRRNIHVEDTEQDIYLDRPPPLPPHHISLDNIIHHANSDHLDFNDDDIDDDDIESEESDAYIHISVTELNSAENDPDADSARPPEPVMETNFNGEHNSMDTETLEPQQINIEDLPWFHGNISRDEVSRRLNAAKNGLFIIRESSSRPGDFALSVSFEAGVFNYIIQTNENNQVHLENSREHFDDLIQLVEHYKRNKYVLPIKLRIPVDKKEIIQTLIEVNESKQAKKDETIAQQRITNQGMSVTNPIVTITTATNSQYAGVINPRDNDAK